MTVTSIQQTEKAFFEEIKKILAYQEALNLIYWDLRTKAPAKAVEGRSQVIGTLTGEVYQLMTSEKMREYVGKLLDPGVRDRLSEITVKSAEHLKKEIDRMIKIPSDEYRQFVELQAKSESVWEEAKEKRDFQLFKPYLEQLVEMTKKFIGYWGYEGHPYNTLLDQYEPGMTVEQLDTVFRQLRDGIVRLLEKIEGSNVRWNSEFLHTRFPKEKQEAFSLEILRQLGYDFAAGRLDETVHPFAIGLNGGDVRITTKYNEQDFRVAIFGTIHEAGHAIYEQNFSEQLKGTPLFGGASMGIHESQSLFHENFIGRNLHFWEHNYGLLQQYAGGAFDSVSLDDFYRAINEVKPSLIRIEADELTYPLHIIIRYELEKALFTGELAVDDLPAVWNDKYEQYLGVRPEHDGHGVLQDVHWSSASFGYFPSYALGYMYAAQLKAAMLKSIPDFDRLLAKGEIAPIRKWLTEHVHQYGRLKKPLEILRDAAGEGLNASHLLNYLREKYAYIYQF
ncbi:carboxypeptidase M32 [Caldibacillus debilis]|uniref:carboxypeptidase M32 n=1 Tax=Caldibacillus debilis TaxID=301148 RepID=UPI000E3765B4|nr:carboxypeptidase M32 [Caldibacillus debilis]REJ28704.1 MAG: carboxypeptidase M32 [Caldibacillus debilis]